MSEANAGKIIQYDYARERRYAESEHEDDAEEDWTGILTLGYRWLYHPVNSRGAIDCQTTTGKVISIDSKSGVICTDAGEILIRG